VSTTVCGKIFDSLCTEILVILVVFYLRFVMFEEPLYEMA